MSTKLLDVSYYEQLIRDPMLSSHYSSHCIKPLPAFSLDKISLAQNALLLYLFHLSGYDCLISFFMFNGDS